uniref:Ig-like domain-containing protein n=1 Tax=Canis lupus familiaris TaxID=9615 RepID=A0A8C0PKY8_CANLF
ITVGFYCLLSPLWLCLHWTSSSNSETVRQSQNKVYKQEGESVTLDCSFTLSFNYYVMNWYQQPFGERMTEVMSIYSDSTSSSKGRYSVSFQKGNKILTLTITGLTLTDSGVYFCAVGEVPRVYRCGNNNYGLHFGAGTRLTVKPNVQDPDPSVYQMRSPKTGRTVCLFTDFDSQADFQKPEGATVISLNSSVLDMKVMDSKSNGALTWNSETNIEFSTLNFKKIVFVSLFLLLDYSCDAKLIEKSFETDMDLNFYNLLVIGLRILLLKVIGFNLFMTLRLWSC